jgi:hypothetical protein
MLRRIALPLAAAALAIAATAPLVTHLADARPIAPGDTPMERLQQENRQLRLELTAALAQRQDLVVGIARLEKLNRSNRDTRSARSIAALIHELQVKNGLGQPWQYHPDDGPTAPSVPPYRPGGPSTTPLPPPTGPGYPQPAPPPITVPPPAPPGHPRPGAGKVVIRPVAMTASAFASLQSAVTDAAYSEQQLAIVKSAAEGAYFTVDQVITLVGLARFEEVRIEIAVAAGARVVDPDRLYLLDRAFSFSGSAEKVRARLGH